MADIEFNLIEEPWIKAVLPDGRVEENSLMTILENSHKYKGLAGEMTAQDIAVLRLLASIVHTVFSRVDIEGNPSPVTEEGQCIERWKNIWDLRQFPIQPVRSYFEKWRDRFWLFHPDRPFYQVPGADIGGYYEVSKLNGAVSESGNSVRIFSFLFGMGKTEMTYAESARWLLFRIGYDDCGVKKSKGFKGDGNVSLGWLGKLGLIYCVGDNLFQTIMLNMPMLYGPEERPWEVDEPVWEFEHLPSIENESVEMPKNLARLYTLQSRRIILKRDQGFVIGCHIIRGDVLDDDNALNEPMTLWKVIENKRTGVVTYKPLLHERNRYVWRNFSVIAVGPESRDIPKPGIISWCDRLRRERVLPKKQMLTFGVVCVRYDSKIHGSITDSFADDVKFHADILSESGKYWREEIRGQIDKIDNAAIYIEWLVRDLRRADGLEPKLDEAYSEAAKQEFYYEIDRIFRNWLMKTDADQEAEERNSLLLALESSVRRIALEAGRNLVNRAGESAFIGRKIKVNKKANREKHYSSPEAFRWFTRNIWTLYPVKGGEAGE